MNIPEEEEGDDDDSSDKDTVSDDWKMKTSESYRKKQFENLYHSENLKSTTPNNENAFARINS